MDGGLDASKTQHQVVKEKVSAVLRVRMIPTLNNHQGRDNFVRVPKGLDSISLTQWVTCYGCQPPCCMTRYCLTTKLCYEYASPSNAVVLIIVL